MLARSRVHNEVGEFEATPAGEAGRPLGAAARLQALLDDALSRVELSDADDDVPDDELQAAWTAALARCDHGAAG